MLNVINLFISNNLIIIIEVSLKALLIIFVTFANIGAFVLETLKTSFVLILT